MINLTFTITKKNISTFLTPGWRLLTVDKKYYKDNFSLTQSADAVLKFDIDNALIDSQVESVQRILYKIKEECTDSIIKLQYRVYESGSTMKCKFPPRAFEYLSAIFVGSSVNYRDILMAEGNNKIKKKSEHKNSIEWFDKNEESFTLTIDSENNTATLTNIIIYSDDTNPFLEYARNAMIQTSYSKVMGLAKKDEEKERDFYCGYKEWMPVSELKKIKRGEVKNVIYMLYDMNDGKGKPKFYVGRADDLRERLDGHQKNPDDPIPNFTHFRYSLIDEQYSEYSYFIEDAAIHDCAAILEMEKRKKYKKSLQKCINEGSIKGVLSDVVMVNTAESQAHVRNKKK